MSDADDLEQMLAAQRTPGLSEPARTLTGEQIATIRTALAEAERALSRINVKGLARAFQRELATARTAIGWARPLVAPAHQQASHQQDRHQQPRT